MVKATQALKEELSKLMELQNQVTKQAVFGGLSHAEAKEYDERQQRIMKIVTTLEGPPKA
jgi:hypothetical protein